VRKLTGKITKSIILLLMALLLVSIVPFFGSASRTPVYRTTVATPISGSIINSTSVEINFGVSNPTQDPFAILSMQTSIFLDGIKCGQVETNSSTGSFNLTGLTQGEHTLQVNVTITLENIFFGGIGDMNLDPVTAKIGVNLPKSTPTITQETSISQPTQLPNNSFSFLAMILGVVIAGAVIVSIALLVIYRKQNLKRKEATE
jgi:hypothetical protein